MCVCVLCCVVSFRFVIWPIGKLDRAVKQTSGANRTGPTPTRWHLARATILVATTSLVAFVITCFFLPSRAITCSYLHSPVLTCSYLFLPELTCAHLCLTVVSCACPCVRASPGDAQIKIYANKYDAHANIRLASLQSSWCSAASHSSGCVCAASSGCGSHVKQSEVAATSVCVCASVLCSRDVLATI